MFCYIDIILCLEHRRSTDCLVYILISMANIIKLNKMPRCYLGAFHIWCPGTSSLVLAINDFVLTPWVHNQCDCMYSWLLHFALPDASLEHVLRRKYKTVSCHRTNKNAVHTGSLCTHFWHHAQILVLALEIRLCRIQSLNLSLGALVLPDVNF